jgi:uroporphyrinogen-III synthase
MSNVILFKALTDAEEGNDQYVNLLTDKFPSVKVWPVSVLKFVFEDPEILVKELEKTEDYEGIILTSPRSVEAVGHAFSSSSLDNDLRNIWREDKICYVVGDSSFDRVSRLLRWNSEKISGQETGNAKNLSQKIIDDFDGKGPVKFLFPCGNLKRDILPDKLACAGISLQISECYKTQQADELEFSIEKFKAENETLDYAIFFSPSGVKFSWEILLRYFPDFESTCKFVSIGPVTTEALKAKNCQHIFTAPTPNVKGLDEAFRSALEH